MRSLFAAALAGMLLPGSALAEWTVASELTYTLRNFDSGGRSTVLSGRTDLRYDLPNAPITFFLGGSASKSRFESGGFDSEFRQHSVDAGAFYRINRNVLVGGVLTFSQDDVADDSLVTLGYLHNTPTHRVEVGVSTPLDSDGSGNNWVGFDISGTYYDVGVDGLDIYTQYSRVKPDIGNDFFDYAVGVDYAFGENDRFAVQAVYTGSGSDAPNSETFNTLYVGARADITERVNLFVGADFPIDQEFNDEPTYFVGARFDLGQGELRDLYGGERYRFRTGYDF